MKRIILAILLCWACNHATTWTGIPNHEQAVCGSFYDTREAVCVVGGLSYACVASQGCDPDLIACAAVAQPPSSIARKKIKVQRDQEEAAENNTAFSGEDE